MADLTTIAQFVGPLLGAGAGTYFGLKGILNGTRETVNRIEDRVGEVRDTVRDSHTEIKALREDMRVRGRE